MNSKTKEEACLDAAGLKEQFNKIVSYEKRLDNLKKSNNELFDLAVACMATELGVADSGADTGLVPARTLKKLLKTAEEEHEDGKWLFDAEQCSKDRMTNFGYTFRIVKTILEKAGENNAIMDFAHNTYGGGATPHNSSLYEKGFVDCIEPKLSEATGDMAKLRAELNRFARNSSTLGNYSYIPRRLPSLDKRDKGLNALKTGVGSAIFVSDDIGNKDSYRVNDQFALFTQWIDGSRKSSDEHDRRIIKQWKEAMLLDGDMWENYKTAAETYFMAFNQDKPAARLNALVEYLKKVNIAIEARTMAINMKLDGESAPTV